jgi:putative membrane protein
MRKLKDYAMLVLKGMGMGASDVVPGVSGGTIAFITGIYEELINSIKSFNTEALKLLFTLKWNKLWKHVNAWFLLSVFSGIFISIFSLSKVLEFLLLNHPVLVWSFFFGLVIASAIMVLRDINEWKAGVIISAALGSVIAFLITSVSPAQTSEAYWFVFLSGALAICAMILPGISGSFILLLLGKYQFILNAVNEMRIIILAVFMAGAVTGIIGFSNVLSWLLRKYKDITIALLAGFMIGSLNKIWPWKEILETYTDSHGAAHPLRERNILPDFSPESHFIPAILLLIFGFALIMVLSRLSLKKNDQ